MEMIVNLLLLGILILCTWSGYKKGIIMGIGGLLAIVVALYGANLVANTFSRDLLPAMRPFATGYMEARKSAEDGIMEQMGWDDTDYSLQDLLERYPERREEFAATCFTDLGVESGTAETLGKRAVAYAEENGTDLFTSAVQVLCETASYLGCFVLAFLLILIVITVIGNLPNLSFKIPNLDWLNDIGGTLLGLATGAAFCIILVWVLKFFGKLIGQDTLAEGWLSHFFLEKDYLKTYLGL